MTIGSRIRALRKAHGWNQTQLAAKLGEGVISQPAISMIEKNVTKEVSGLVLAHLCRVFNTTPELLMFGEGDGDFEAQAEVAEITSIAKHLNALGRQHLLESARLVQRLTAPKGSKTDPFRVDIPADASQPTDKLLGDLTHAKKTTRRAKP